MTSAPRWAKTGGVEDLVPAHDGGRPVGARLESDQAAALEHAVVADRIPVGRVELGDRHRVRDRDAEHPDVRLATRTDADRAVVEHPDRLHLGHPRHLVFDVGDGRPDALDRRVDDDERADRFGFGALGLLGQDAVEGVRDAGSGDGQPDRAADHRITVRHRVTPAASMASSARSPSPGSRSTAAIASVRTDVRKPSAAASMAVALTQ